jgi:hypothetical protein
MRWSSICSQDFSWQSKRSSNQKKPSVTRGLTESSWVPTSRRQMLSFVSWLRRKRSNWAKRWLLNWKRRLNMLSKRRWLLMKILERWKNSSRKRQKHMMNLIRSLRKCKKK